MVNHSLKFSICLFEGLVLCLTLLISQVTYKQFSKITGPVTKCCCHVAEAASQMLAELSPGAAFLCCLPFPINSQHSSLIARAIVSVLMILAVCITQRCSATRLLPIKKKQIEIIILCVTKILLCVAAVPFKSMLVLLLLREKSLTASSQVLDDAGECIWQPGGDSQGLGLHL